MLGFFFSMWKITFPRSFSFINAVWLNCCVLCAVGFWPLCVVHVLCAFHSLILCSFSYDSDVYELQNHDFNCRWKRDARYFLWFVDALHGRFKCFSSVVVAHAVVCVFFRFFLLSSKDAFQETSSTRTTKNFSFEFYTTQNPHSKRNTL